jgi:hypothetical protein
MKTVLIQPLNRFRTPLVVIMLCGAFALFPACGNKPDDKPSGHLRLDGIYQAKLQPGIYSYLRFYNDDWVISISETNGDPLQVAKWFNREHSGSSTGSYTNEAGHVKFDSTSADGVVTYDCAPRTGTSGGDGLECKTKSMINRRSNVASYKFIPLTESHTK